MTNTNTNTNKRTIDITGLTDLQLDAFLALAAGDDSFVWDSLTVSDLLAVQAASGRDLRAWITHARLVAPPALPNYRGGIDYETMIFDAQEDGGRNIG